MLCQKIFSQEIRLKDENGKDFPEWEQVKLGDIATFSKGEGVSKAAISSDGKYKCIRYGELDTSYKELIGNIVSRTSLKTSKSKLSKINDILMPTSDVTPSGLSTASAFK